MPIIHCWSLCPKVKNLHQTKLVHCRSMSYDRRLFKGLISTFILQWFERNLMTIRQKVPKPHFRVILNHFGSFLPNVHFSKNFWLKSNPTRVPNTMKKIIGQFHENYQADRRTEGWRDRQNQIHGILLPKASIKHRLIFVIPGICLPIP